MRRCYNAGVLGRCRAALFFALFRPDLSGVNG
nr:MAG TPA: hypothetical protein [Caudoviricetes sp.]